MSRQPAKLGDASHIPEMRRATKGDVATFFGVSPTTVDQWIRRGVPALQRGARGTPWVFDLLDVCAWRFGAHEQKQGSADTTDPEQMSPKERLEYYRGNRERDLHAKERDLLVPCRWIQNCCFWMSLQAD